MPTPRTNYAAPIVPVSTDWGDYTIRPCHDCLPWYAQVWTDDTGAMHLIEWHAVDCPFAAQGDV